DRRDRGRVQGGGARDRLQLALPARHHRADRRHRGPFPDGRRRLAYAGARRCRRERALRAHADAGMTAPPINALAYSPDAVTGAAPALLAVRQLRLTDFRNSRQLRLDCDLTPVVLVGANGAGKTNLLEALSFLVPGRGLRRARLDEVCRRQIGGSRSGEEQDPTT